MKIKRRFLSLLLAICLVAGLVPATVFAAEPESFVTSANANHWGRSDLRAYLNNAAKTDGTLPLDTMSADNGAKYPGCFSGGEYALVQLWTYGTAVYDASQNITSVYETTDRFTLPAAVGNNDYVLTWGEGCDNDALSDKNRVIPISYWSGGTSSNAWLRSASSDNSYAYRSNRGDSVADSSVDGSSGVAPVFKIDLSSISFAAAASAAQVAGGSDIGDVKIQIEGSSNFGKSTGSSLPSYGMYLKTMSQDDFDVTSVNFGSSALTVHYTDGVAGQYVVVQAYKEDSLTDETTVYAAAGKIIQENSSVPIDVTGWNINSLDGYTIKVWMEDGSGASLAAATTPVTFVGVDSNIMQTTFGAAENLRVFAEKDKLQTSWGDLSALSEADYENVANGQPTSAGIVAGANPTNQKIYFGVYDGSPLEFWIAGRETAANGGSIASNGEVLTLYQARTMGTKQKFNSSSSGYSVEGKGAITLQLTDGLTVDSVSGNAASYPAESITLTGQDGLDKSNLQFQYRSTGESAWSNGMPTTVGTYELRCYLPGTDNYERTYSAPVTVTVHEHSWSGDWSSDGGYHWHECTVAGCPITDNSQKDGYAVHSYNQQVVSDTYLASAATCTAPAKYYYSCVCGAKGTETFENGDALGHSWGSWQSNGNDTHTRTCSVCGDTESQNCFGGTATCTAQALCAVCGDTYGAVDPTNHTGTEAWITTDTMHTKVWRCCQAVIEAEEEHNWENGTCTICQYPCQHTGGTATCSQLAVCDICGSQYGDYDADNHKAVSAWTQENGKHYHKCEYGCDTHLDEAECSGGTATCTAQALCAVCGGTYGAVDPTNHTGTEAWITTDTMHTKVWRCCQAVIEAEEEHNWENGTCTICQYPCQHTGGTATCSQLAVCDICGSQYGDYDADNHKAVSAWTQENGKHYHKCEYGCDTHLDEAECSGGTATCTAQALCAVCGGTYGAVDPTNHTGTEAWITTDTMHTKVWRCCQAVIEAEEEHNWENGTCTICQYPCQHTGGTATCSQLAVCDICGSQYGDYDADNHKAVSAWTQENGKHYKCEYGCDTHLDEAECSGGTATRTAQALCAVCGGTYGAVDPTNHTGTEAWITTDTMHTKVWRCCQAVIEAEEEHNWENGTCTICQYPCQHTGGTATCSQLAVCDICGSQYGDYDADNHKAVSAWTQENGKHYHKCEYGCDTHLDEAECSGGEATCTAPAVCETCGNAYGVINPDNHTGTVVWTKTATTHSSAYSCCNAPVVAEEVHEWQNGVCSECGYECQHDGGTATCTQKAVCDICGEEYGEVNASNHTNLIKTEAKPATHMTEGNIEYWYCDGCGKYFSDEAGTKEIALANTVIPKLTEHTADGTGWHSDETNHWNTCECGEKLSEAAHTFEWVTDKEATATEAGSRHKECTVCGYEEAAVEIPATGTTDPSEPPTDTDKPSGDQTGDTTSPQTGDDSNIALWMALMLAAGAVLTGTAVYSRKRKYSR